MDDSTGGIRGTFEAIKATFSRALVLPDIPIRRDYTIKGDIDLISEHAFQWQPSQESKLVESPDSLKDEEELARTEMLGSLADFDDALLETLLKDVTPTLDEIYANITRDLKNRILPVFCGSAEQDSGVRRLMKSLRHGAPGISTTAKR